MSLYEDKEPHVDASQVESRIFVGTQDAACNGEWLAANNILFILNIGAATTPLIESLVGYKRIMLSDEPESNILAEFDNCFEFIEKALNYNATSAILVHCQAGISRSPTIVCAYLMRRHGWTVEAALGHIRAVRNIGPNFGFRLQLKSYQQSLTLIRLFYKIRFSNSTFHSDTVYNHK
jgi:hypothetical protein